MVDQGRDNRRHPRRKVLKSAKAFIRGGASLYDCQVRDWSEGGARLVFPELTPLPRRFTLQLSDGTEYRCEVVRVAGPVIGVRFVEK
jgi:hypothetical protein